jgi:rhomboid protease GluP
MAAGPETPVARAPGRRVAEEWALVLASEGLEPTVRFAEGGYVLFVPAEQAARASASLGAYAAERRAHESRPPPDSDWAGDAPLTTGVSLAGALLLFFLVTGPWQAGAAWFGAGAADAERILAGEIWRTVTALTLHADAAHVLANALTGALFATAVCRAFGPGLGVAAIVLAGAGGNLANAFFHATTHLSVGASTAVFGAVGILGGAGRGPARRSRRRRAAVTVAASLGLLAMLGTGGERTDLWAHGFGLVVGLAFGTGLARRVHRPPGLFAQTAYGAFAVALVLGSWWLAWVAERGG